MTRVATQPGFGVALGVAAVGTVAPPLCAALALRIAWVRQAVGYPVLSAEDLLAGWQRGAMVAALSSGVAFASLLVLLWLLSCRGPRSAPRCAQSRGTSLLEVVCLTGILAVALAILMPSRIRSAERARQATCAANVWQITAALNRYAAEHDGYMPPTTWMDDSGPVRRQANWLETVGAQHLRCPSRADSRPTYGYNSMYLRFDRPGSREVVRARADHPAETILAADGCVTLFAPSSGLWSNGWFVHGGRANIGWLDGHVTCEGQALMCDDSMWDRR